MSSNECAIGVDLGRTNIRVAKVVDGRVIDFSRQRTRSSEEWNVVADQVIEIVTALTGRERALGIGVGIAGQCSFKGVIRPGPNFWWPNAPLRSYLQEKMGIPSLVVNDTRAATYGEWKYGAGRGFEDLVCLFVGTGLGGGVVSAGRLLSGCSNTAGELGHIIVKMGGPLCGCGNRGCLESIVSGLGISNRAKEEAKLNPDASAVLIKMAGGDSANISSDMVAIASSQGDSLAQRIVMETAEVFTAGIVSLIHAFNPKRVIVGGGVVAGIPELLRIPQMKAKSMAMCCTCEQLEIVPSSLGDSAGAVGAASLLTQAIKEKRKEWH